MRRVVCIKFRTVQSIYKTFFMKFKQCLFVSILIIALTSFKPLHRFDEYEVEEFYKGIEPTSGTVVLTENEEIKEAELILVPIKLDVGKYIVNISRKASDLY